MTDHQPIIQTEALTKAFGDQPAVSNLNLTVPAGTIFGLIGPSGCGKTTTVRLLTGILTPDSGRVEVMNRVPKEFSRQLQAQLGYMPQQFVLYPDLTVWENLNFAASLYGMPLRRKKRLKTILDLVELAGHEKKKALNLSGGMQRRLALAIAIVHDPRLVFFDEPTAGIDPVLRRKFWDYFQALREAGRTLIVTTQYVSEASYCDYVGVMMAGRLLMVETPGDLRRRALGGEIVRLQTANFLDEGQMQRLRQQPFVVDGKATRLPSREVEIVVDNASTALPLLLEWCQDEQITVESAKDWVPPFDDIFVTLIEQEDGIRSAVGYDGAAEHEIAVLEELDA